MDTDQGSSPGPVAAKKLTTIASRRKKEARKRPSLLKTSKGGVGAVENLLEEMRPAMQGKQPEASDFFEDIIKAEWALPGSGNSLTSIAKQFYALRDDTSENLKVPLVDTPVVALRSRAILPKDRQGKCSEGFSEQEQWGSAKEVTQGIVFGN
ncbi:UNVERIFIED_CONTAM: hypothetical protein K2H54_048819 [Gekko kuhli]